MAEQIVQWAGAAMVASICSVMSVGCILIIVFLVKEFIKDWRS